MVGFDIREAKLFDYNDICKLNEKIDYIYDKDRVFNKLSNIIENTNNIILIAQLNDDVIGYIHVVNNEVSDSEVLIDIIGFIVDEKYRSLGVGRQLIKEVKLLFKSNNYSSIRLDLNYNKLEENRIYENKEVSNENRKKDYDKLFKLVI